MSDMLAAMMAAADAKKKYDGTTELVQQRNAAVVLGDSISALGGNQTGNEGANHFAQASVRSKQRIRFLYNAGIPSNKTDQMLARLQTDVIDKNPGVCIILAGTNNVGSPMVDPLTLGSPSNDIVQIVARLKTAGIRPVLCTIPPRSDNLALNVNVVQYNAWLTVWGEHEGVQVVDFYSALVNPATGGFATGMGEADGVHPTPVGNGKMADLLVASLAPALPDTKPRLVGSAADTSDLLGGVGLFLNDAGADGYGDGWTISGTAVGLTPSLVTDATILGKWQKISRAAGSTGDVTLRKEFFSGWAVGDRLALAGRIKTVGCLAGGHKYTIQLDIRGAAGTVQALNPIYIWNEDIPDGIIYREFIVPAGATNIRVNLTSHGTGGGDVSLAQWCLYNHTTLKV